MIKNLIFDLDGTLLDTITDIDLAINDALEASDIPYRYSKEECRFLIGNGADVLMHKALKDLDNDDNFQRLKKEYMPRYKDYQNRHTAPFEGVTETLRKLQNLGISLFVCTNKPDNLAINIVRNALPTVRFEEVRGLRTGEKPKPDPAIVDSFVMNHSLKKEETLFVGDSITDLRTAQNASLHFGLCLWGYGEYDEALKKSADIVFEKPADFERILKL